MQYRLVVLVLLTTLGMGAGCIVPQPRGVGLYKRVREPRTGAIYHLYLPVDYVRHNGRPPNYPEVKRWPLVMTFHGMKPYDNALPQEREWEKQADIYGYIVCAPELHSSDSFMEYPLTKEHSYVLKDRENVSAIMDHVFVTTLADPKRVLSTSWSSGGYLAHYFPNRFPDRFSCIATRLSNFSAKLMLEETVPRYRDRVAVGIFAGDSDLPATKVESQQAVAWYMARHFKTVRGKMIDGMGHSRIPQVAAAFFAEQLGIKPRQPVEAEKTLAKVHMTEYHPPLKLIAQMSPKPSMGVALASGPRSRSARLSARSGPSTSSRLRRPTHTYISTNAGRDYPFERRPHYDLQPERRPEVRSSGVHSSTPPTAAGAIRVASAQPHRGNWLEPIKTIDRQAKKRPDDVSKNAPKNTTASLASRQSKSARPIGQRDSLLGTHPIAEVGKPDSRNRSPARETVRKAAAPAPRKSKTTKKSPQHRFSPQDAGPRNYDVWLAQTSHNRDIIKRTAFPQGGSSKTRVTKREVKNKPTSARRRNTPQSPPASGKQGNQAKRVHIKFNVPAIGTAPVYVSYRADLPRKILAGADFLWRDNDMWMGDEPRGVKILESPGFHRLTLLMITRENVEYRGIATIQVLQRDPSVSSSSQFTR